MTTRMLRGNRGEWSEVYVFLKLLGEGRLYAADENLKSIPSLYYDIIKIIREETKGKKFEYVYNGNITIVEENTSRTIATFPARQFLDQAKKLLDLIKSSDQTTFSDSSLEGFLRSINVSKLKEPSREKRDITIKIHDYVVNAEPTLGFSIKSRLGSDPTLLNPSEGTNFIFEITGEMMNDDEMKRINLISGRGMLQKRLKEITKIGCSFSFDRIQDKTFQNNLKMIDSELDKIVAWIVILRYSKLANSTVQEIVNNLHFLNPLKYDTSEGHRFYEHKIANFMVDVALGMTPSTVWTGTYDATGGYIIVKEDGDVVCYHFYFRNVFEQYLLRNVRLDTPSSSRYGFGSIYKKDGKYLIKLNLQLRFIS